MTSRPWHVLAAAWLASCAAFAAPASADPTTIENGPWQMYKAGTVTITNPTTRHGDPSLYDDAPAIPPDGSDWKPLMGSAGYPLNPDDINYLGPHDNYSSDLVTCLTQAEFTYFQSIVTVPADFNVETARVKFGPLDDGARVVVINSDYPDGRTPDDGYAMIGDMKDVDLQTYLRAGDDNRIVIEHVDDCAGQSWLGTVQLEVSGEPGSGGGHPTWGHLKVLYR